MGAGPEARNKHSVEAPLHGVRVLECGDTLAAAYAGRLLCDLGADVVKVERGGGDPLRAVGPFVGGVPDRDMSGSFGYYNAGKRSVVAHDGALPAAFARRADVIVRCTRAGDDWLSDDVIAEISEANPALIVADISTFGRTGGPAASDRHPMSDLLALAAGGLLSVNASSPTDPHATPLRYRGELASVHSASDAVIAILGALFVRRRTGLGQRIDVSAQAAVAAILATGLARFSYVGDVPVRDGTRSVAPWGFYHCSDGMVLIQCTEDREFQRLLTLLGDPDWGQMEVFETTAQRELVTDVLDPLVNEGLASFTVDELVAAAYVHRVPVAAIHSATDILGWAHLAARGFWRQVGLSDGYRQAEVTVPGVGWRYRSSGEPEPSVSAPRLGEATAAAASLWPERPAVAVPAGGPDEIEGGRSKAPLAGVRVIDMTWVWAGPFAAMQLAHLGAEVIKVESGGRIDVTRRLGPHVDGVVGINRSGYFNQYNQGKQSVTLDLKDPRGLKALRGLIATADVVIDNMSAGALGRMGLSYEELLEINPRIVAVSMTGFGESGPERDRMAYGSLIDALSGAAAANGLVGGGPTDFPMSLPDPAAGIHTAIATVAAIYRTQVTGMGERVECSMLEANVAAFPWPVLFASVNGSGAPVIGNRDDLRSPHGVYRSGGGGDRWVAVAVETDAQFASLAEAIGQPELADDPRFAALPGRRLHENDLDRILSDWAAARSQGEAVAGLQDAGVPAEAVAGVDDLFSSETLLERDFFTLLDHPEIGVRPLAGVGWQTSLSPMVATSAAPLLGQHTRTVLTEILGFDDEQIDAMEADGVLR
jgi:crotonobetainyl-CoA:carnitine CoA-transferase CaiB-like acyl-CoA transferase